MRWTIIKKGTNGDHKTPTISDDSVKDDFVAIEMARKILYENENLISLKVVFFKHELGEVVKFSNKYYKILSSSVSDLPFMTLTLKELPNV